MTGASTEPVNVAIAVPGNPERARVIISSGRRIASRFGLQWIAVRILPTPLPRERRATPGDLSALVTALGGRLLCAEARDIARALIEVSCREHARVLVIGRSRRPRLLRRLRRGTTERILEAARPFDVIVAVERVSP